MRKLLSTSLLLAAISTCIQADQPFDHPRQRNGLSDLLAALEGAQLGGAGAKNGNGGNAAQGNGAHEGQGEKGNGGDQGGRQGGQADSKTVTVTEQAQQAASNQTCEAIKTVTKTVSVPGVAAVGTGGLQLSFVTETAFASGPAPTVTVTPLAQFITQMVTVTVNGANAAQPLAEPSNVPAGVNPPAGAAGTGAAGSKTAGIVKTSNAAQPDVASGVNPPSGAAGTAGTGSKTAAIVKTSDPTRPDVASGAAAPGVNPPQGAGGTGSTAAIVKTNNPAAGNTPTAAPAAVSQPPVGAPGAMASGVGTLVAGGACDCSCLCGAGSFPNAMGAGGIGEMGQAPVATTLSTAAIVQPGTPAAAPQNTPAAAQPQVGNSATLSSAAIVKTGQPGNSAPVPQSQVASSASLPAAQPQIISSATLSSTAIVQTTAPASQSTAAAQSQSGASTLELSVSAPLGQAAALANPSSTSAAVPNAAQINISTFSLTSSLVLGSLATPRAKA